MLVHVLDQCHCTLLPSALTTIHGFKTDGIWLSQSIILYRITCYMIQSGPSFFLAEDSELCSFFPLFFLSQHTLPNSLHYSFIPRDNNWVFRIWPHVHFRLYISKSSENQHSKTMYNPYLTSWHQEGLKVEDIHGMVLTFLMFLTADYDRRLTTQSRSRSYITRVNGFCSSNQAVS